MISRYAFLALLLVASLALPAEAIAAPYAVKTTSVRGLFAVLGNAVDVALKIGAVLALVFIIVSGIRIATAGGDPKAIAAARSSFVLAILGAVLTVGGVFVVRFIMNLTGVTGIDAITPPPP